MINDHFKRYRERLLQEVATDAAKTANYTGRASFSPDVLAALGRLQREHFVPAPARRNAYENRPLPIGYGQTISQPFIVALMTDLLDLRSTDRVLEIGTGCGYQTAMLAELVAEVFTVEVITKLQEGARDRLSSIGYTNIRYKIGDGWTGWPKEAPFDAIIVTAAASAIPRVLTAQLGRGGRMVVPVGQQNETQFLMRRTRKPNGALLEERGLPVAFVPLVKNSTGNT
ncbi:MAG: protein-L-isoaspartate(D-aspartate) O-methyltransferase [Pseudomonadota bacterium]|nr:protein-L-isoaspartate(D-aspartate) O-methyltransferase [Pseudomonadota bacterium]